MVNVNSIIFIDSRNMYLKMMPRNLISKIICVALRDLVPFTQLKKHEKHRWRSANFRKPATLLKLTLLHGCLSHSLNCANGIKLRNAPHICG